MRNVEGRSGRGAAKAGDAIGYDATAAIAAARFKKDLRDNGMSVSPFVGFQERLELLAPPVVS
jgi:hypothetical protein